MITKEQINDLRELLKMDDKRPALEMLEELEKKVPSAKDLMMIKNACTEQANAAEEYLSSDIGSKLPLHDRIEIVREINKYRNDIIPKLCI